MSIIPISPKQVLTHIDENGTEWYLRYLTGEQRIKYQELQDLFYKKAKKFETIVKKKLGKKASQEKIYRETLQHAKNVGEITVIDEDRHMVGLIDLIISGWKGKGLIEKAANTKASEYFSTPSMIELMEIIGIHIKELIGLTVSDQKN